jgi:hypothetical protein
MNTAKRSSSSSSQRKKAATSLLRASLNEQFMHTGSDFFNCPRFLEFRQNQNIVKALGTRVILTLDELKTYMLSSLPTFSKLTGRRDVRGYISNYINDQVDRFIKDTASTVCGESIGPDYAEKSFRAAFSNARHSAIAKYDIIVVMNESQFRPSVNAESNFEEYITKKIANIVGFLIVEIGECKSPAYKDYPCIKLICTSPRVTPPIKASVLLGAFLTCVKANSSDGIGLLELADGYTNVPGVCAYTKMGFIEDVSNDMGNPSSCFDARANLPMSCDTKRFTYEYIMQLSADMAKEPKHRICNFLPVKRTSENETLYDEQMRIQTQMAHLYNIMMRLKIFYTRESMEEVNKFIKYVYPKEVVGRMDQSVFADERRVFRSFLEGSNGDYSLSGILGQIESNIRMLEQSFPSSGVAANNTVTKRRSMTPKKKSPSPIAATKTRRKASPTPVIRRSTRIASSRIIK